MGRWLLIVILALMGPGAGACNEDEGLADGELCNAHVECASGLCTIGDLPEAGLPDGGTPPKRCQPTGI
jgi:hypothetical protein